MLMTPPSLEQVISEWHLFLPSRVLNRGNRMMVDGAFLDSRYSAILRRPGLLYLRRLQPGLKFRESSGWAQVS